MVTLSCAFTRVSSSSELPDSRSPRAGRAGAAGSVAAAPSASLVEQDEEEAARGIAVAQHRPDDDGDRTGDLSRGTRSARTPSTLVALLCRLVQRRPQIGAQLRPHQPAAGRATARRPRLQVAAGALGEVHDVVLLGDDHRRRRVLLEQALVQLDRGDGGRGTRRSRVPCGARQSDRRADVREVGQPESGCVTARLW